MTFSLTPDDLLGLYARGVFPMADSRDDPDLYVVDPPMRGVLPLDQFHLSRRLARTVRQNRFEVRVDPAFDAVVEGCAGGGPERPKTWINAEIQSLYGELHRRAVAHSIEIWQAGELVGGLYGVSLGGAFCGESMFSRATDASKVAMVHLIARMWAGGFLLLDCQFLTSHLATFGGVEIPRRTYRMMLKAALDRRGDFYRMPMAADGACALQAISQRS